MKELLRTPCGKSDKTEEIQRERKACADNLFNIIEVDGSLFVTFDGHIVSRKGDTDLLDRLMEYRRLYIDEESC